MYSRALSMVMYALFLPLAYFVSVCVCIPGFGECAFVGCGEPELCVRACADRARSEKGLPASQRLHPAETDTGR